MKRTEPNSDPKARESYSQRLPRRIFFTVVLLVCSALFLSGIHTLITLQELRVEYLRNRGRDIANSLHPQFRGPQRRNSPDNWRERIEEAFDTADETLVAMILMDGAHRVIARAGEKADALVEIPAGLTGELFVYQQSLPQGRGPRWEAADFPAGLVLKIGLDPGQAAFISRQAYLHVVVTMAAIVLIIGLSVYLARTTDQFVALKVREESEKHLKTLGKMSATLAHEIRNPLSAMKGLTQVVQEDLPEGHPSQNLMATVVTEAERLEALVTDLLTFARPGKSTLSAFGLSILIRSVIDFLSVDADRQQVVLTFDPDSSDRTIVSDPDALRQVLINVILNAIQASPPQSLVTIKAAGEAGALVIEVIDSGCGIGALSQEELFEPFRTTKTNGSGLGLAISRRLIENLGGTIALENRIEGGTLCRLRLPDGNRQHPRNRC